MPIQIGCGVSGDLTDLLGKLDDMIDALLNGIGDVTGAIASTISGLLDAIGTALGKMLPDISGLIPDISYQAGIEALLNLIEGSADYLAKLAELTLQFGEALLNAGLNIFDIIAEAAAGLLKGLDPCTLIPEFKFNGTDARETANNIGNASVAAEKEKNAEWPKSKAMTKPVGLLYQRYVAPVLTTTTGLGTETTLY